MSGSSEMGLTVVVFTWTYAGLAWGKLPGLQTDRTGIAWAGAALVLAFRLLSFDKAVEAIDFATIGLLLGMMVVVGMLRLSGFFDLLTTFALKRVASPLGLLAAIMTLSGVLSAILVNDVVCLALTPLVLDLARRLEWDPKPHVIGLALASNIGSVATLTGNPQNMIVGNLSHISYLRFAALLAPLAIAGLLAAFLLTALIFRSSLVGRRTAGPEKPDDRDPHRAGASLPNTPVEPAAKGSLVKCLLVTVGVVALFSAGMQMEVVALCGAAILLLGRVKPESIYREIDWKLLVLFAGLFVVVRAFEVHVVHAWGVENWTAFKSDPVGLLSLVSAFLSNVVSNVPAVLLFRPIIPAFPEAQQEVAWLALAMSSTFAGNLTILGSVANLIVVECARQEHVDVTFWDYCKAGVPVTFVTLAMGIGWLWFLAH